MEYLKYVLATLLILALLSVAWTVFKIALGLVIAILSIPVNLAASVVSLFINRQFDLKNVSHKTVGFGVFKIYLKRDVREAGYIFEHFIKDISRTLGMGAEIAMDLKDRGEYPKELYASNGDCGIDVIAWNENDIVLIQTKFYSKALTKSIVAESKIAFDIFKRHYAAKGEKRTIKFMIITNSKLDNTARIMANEVGIQYVEGPGLNELIYKANKASSLKKGGWFKAKAAY